MKESMTVGIIGGTGGMGRWFADLLQKEGCVVHVWGRKSAMSIEDLVNLCNVIVVSVPISVTSEMIKRVGPLVTSNKLLMDLTSLKKKPVELMLTHSPAEVVGCHPLFGPHLKDVKGQNVVLCHGRGDNWFAWLKRIFDKNGLIVTEKKPEEHDKMMAFIQVLNHLNTICLGLVLSESGIPLSEINKFSTPIFQTKMDIISRIFKENPGLYTDIIAQNSSTTDILDLYEKTLVKVRRLIEPDGTKLKEAMEQVAKNYFNINSELTY